MEEKELQQQSEKRQEQQEITKEIESPTETQEQQSESEPEPEQKQDIQQRNFKALREEKERLEREHAQAMKRVAEYENMLAQSTSKKQEAPEEDLEIRIGDDDLFEGKHYKKLQKQLKKQQDALKQYQEQMQLTTIETKLHTKYADFDKVVSPENIKKLRETEPELAEALASTPDLYSKAISAYKMIKKLGIYIEDNYKQERELAHLNNLKPKSSASISPQRGDSPLTKANMFANGLTPELKKQLWQEMVQASKRH